MPAKEHRPTGLEWEIPVDTYSPLDKNSFAYTTVVKRWPTIITQIISTLSSEIHRLTVASGSNSAISGDEKAATTIQIQEGKQIISRLSALKHDMGRDRPLDLIEDDGGSNVEVYNRFLRPASEAGEPWTWFSTAWLFAECYLYRRIRNFFAVTTQWREFDPFFTSKSETYAASLEAIVHLARALDALPADLQTGSTKSSTAEPGPLEVAFMEMALANLWGNATDLSLLVDLKYEDLQALQSVGREAQKERERYVLRNDLGQAWARVKEMREGKGRVDFVLDNAGFELYTDLIFADFLLTHTAVSEVVFHPKTIPWFVSDVLPKDFTWAIDILQSRDFFPSIKDEDRAILTTLSKRWQEHLAAGRFRLSIPLDTPLGTLSPFADFWTGPLGYAHMPEVDPGLVEELSKADLVIFKGDLNYRKLLGDGKWDATTPFEDVLGPLKGKITCLSLRTNKADPIAGLAPGIQERLDVEDPKWRESGKWAVISFCPKDV